IFKPTLTLHYENCPRIFAPEQNPQDSTIPFLPLKPTILPLKFWETVILPLIFAPETHYFCP
ncbi:TPA: hypothetical protein ACG658_004534, partial [Escherichia coli]